MLVLSMELMLFVEPVGHWRVPAAGELCNMQTMCSVTNRARGSTQQQQPWDDGYAEVAANDIIISYSHFQLYVTLAWSQANTWTWQRQGPLLPKQAYAAVSQEAAYRVASPTGMLPRRARPITTLLAQPAWASIQEPLSKRPLTCCPSDVRLPAMAALASSFSPVSIKYC